MPDAYENPLSERVEDLEQALARLEARFDRHVIRAEKYDELDEVGQTG